MVELAEASLASCQWPTGTLIVGQPYQMTIVVNQGPMIAEYKIIFSGDLIGESTPFTVNAGIGQQQFTIGDIVFTTGGTKVVTALLYLSSFNEGFDEGAPQPSWSWLTNEPFDEGAPPPIWMESFLELFDN